MKLPEKKVAGVTAYRDRVIEGCEEGKALLDLEFTLAEPSKRPVQAEVTNKKNRAVAPLKMSW